MECKCTAKRILSEKRRNLAGVLNKCIDYQTQEEICQEGLESLKSQTAQAMESVLLNADASVLSSMLAKHDLTYDKIVEGIKNGLENMDKKYAAWSREDTEYHKMLEEQAKAAAAASAQKIAGVTK